MTVRTRFTMHPMLALFLKLTAIVTIGIVLLVVAAFLLKIAFFAAILAAIGVGGYFLYNMIRRRHKYPVIR
jgi:energy-converting hydrogenase Eha subunit C